MAKRVATLTMLGYIDTPAEKMEEAMLGFFYSIPHQSFIYRNLRPLPFLVARFGNDEIDFKNETVSSLQDHLIDYFDTAEVNGSTAITASGGINLTLDINVVDDGKTHSAGYLISTQTSKLKAIIDLNNDGKPLPFTGA